MNLHSTAESTLSDGRITRTSHVCSTNEKGTVTTSGMSFFFVIMAFKKKKNRDTPKFNYIYLNLDKLPSPLSEAAYVKAQDQKILFTAFHE